MPRISALTSFRVRTAPDPSSCCVVATPAARRRLPAVATAALFLVVFAAPALAQEAAGGKVQLIVRAEAVRPVPLEADDQALLWMSPTSALETERIAVQWAAGAETEALQAWRSVVKAEAGAQRLDSEQRLEAAVDWIAARVGVIAAEGADVTRDQLWMRRLMGIRSRARSAALESIGDSSG